MEFCNEDNIDQAILVYSDCSTAHLKKAFVHACSNGHIFVAKWLDNLIVPCYDCAVFLAGINNHHIVVDWIKSMKNTKEFSDEKLFLISCESGYIEVVKNINVPNEIFNCGFVFACSNGHIDIVKWLLMMNADIHHKNDLPFRQSVCNLQYDVALFLYNNGANINAQNDHAFRWSCSRKDIFLIRWLSDIDNMLIPKLLHIIDRSIMISLGMSDSTINLLECIVQNSNFPIIDEIDDVVLYSLCYHNKKTILESIKNIVPYLHYEIINDVVTNYHIQKVMIKNARSKKLKL